MAKEIEIYANFMEEVKLRLDFIDAIVNGKVALNPMLLQEIAYLQLRMICEIIALSCLVAHGDITKIPLDGFGNDYDADTIIKKLSKLHPDFYPKPVTLVITPKTAISPGAVHMDAKPHGFLTKKELLSLYGRTGNYAHRGRLKSIQTSPPYVGVDFGEIVRWTQKIVVLLESHLISSMDMRKNLVVILKSADFNNRVQIGVAEAP